MDEEQKRSAILERLEEMGIEVNEPVYTLTWDDVVRVMVETEGFDHAADFPTDLLVNMLNTIQDGLEELEWYSNIQNSLRLAEQNSIPAEPPQTEDGHLESEYEDRITGTGE
jgi:hypothetical protein